MNSLLFFSVRIQVTKMGSAGEHRQYGERGQTGKQGQAGEQGYTGDLVSVPRIARTAGRTESQASERKCC